MRRWILILAVLAALRCLPVAASAHDVPEAGRKGSIAVSFGYGGRPVSGGSLTLYRVGAVSEENGNYSFTPTGVFDRWNGSLNNLDSAEQSRKTAVSLADFAERLPARGTTKTIGRDGKVTFSGLEQGLYLLVQKKAPDGYRKATPFLVSVPFCQDGSYVYAVDASMKTELERCAKPGNPPRNCLPKLPQTGQLNWPVPVLAILGMTVFSLGWALRFGKQSKDEK